MRTKRLFIIILAILSLPVVAQESKILEIDTAKLRDKVMGGWAGQVIGVTFGAETEFKFGSTWIHDYTPIRWYDGLLLEKYNTQPGLYDDIYMDLTFVEVIEEKGLNATSYDYAMAFAYADYDLWHANQQARYNIMHGIMPPESGHWRNNPEASSIDFQIEADFAGLMCPGMPNEAARFCDTVGHIMNYGEGWYGGVFVAGMYSLAYIYDDVETIIKEALKLIPEQSSYYQCMSDVLKWHKENPDDWHRCWFEIELKYGSDNGSPLGVFVPFNITAATNSAYVVMALLYGDGDFGKTISIATRAGNDSDCNPATAAGILGVIMGYSALPEYWTQGLDDVEDMDFKYTTISLNDVYKLSYNHAIMVAEMNGGKIEKGKAIINTQDPVSVGFEENIPDHYPVGRIWLQKEFKDTLAFDFEGIGFAVLMHAFEKMDSNYVYEVDMYINDELAETIELPADFKTRRFIPIYKYDMPRGKYNVKLILKNYTEDKAFISVFIGPEIHAIIYDNKESMPKY